MDSRFPVISMDFYFLQRIVALCAHKLQEVGILAPRNFLYLSDFLDNPESVFSAHGI